MPGPLTLGIGAIVLYAVYRAYTAFFPPTGLGALPAPQSANPLFGNMREVLEGATFVPHERWARAHGPVLAYRALLNRPRLMTMDLRAVQHIMQRTDVYHKPDFIVQDISAALGAGVLVAEGDQHRTQRKALNPAFGPSQLRELTGVMTEKAHVLRDAWAALLGEKDTVELEVISWLSRCTLDIIGLAGFGYTFDALAGDGKPSELLSAFRVVFEPDAVRSVLNMVVPGFRHLPTAHNRQTKHALGVMTRIGTQLLAERKAAAALEAAQGEKLSESRARDLLSLLVRANTAANPRERLSDADVIGQIPTFLLAGHETTSSLLAWLLFELAANPDTQARLRAECCTVSLPAGGAPLDAPVLSALDKLPLLDAVVRETLRLHPPVSGALRTAQQDDVVPLSRPFVDTKGVEQTTIAMRKGDSLVMPILLVNRDPELWGPDADEWKPARWTGAGTLPTGIPGVWGNMLSFLGGSRACIGFKFSLYETKIILHTLICAFDFELVMDKAQIEGRGGFLRPHVRGRKEGGLPLRVRRAAESEP